MAHVKSTATRDGATVEEVSRDLNIEKAPSGEAHGDSGSVNIGFGLVHAGQAGLQSARDADAAFDEGSRSYCFGPSTVTVSHIQEMMMLNYFTEGGARAAREETILEPEDDEAIVFKEFFLYGLGCLCILLLWIFY
jgi:hypothetical protein